MQKIILLLFVCYCSCMLHAQNITLPVLGKDSTDLLAFVNSGFSFTDNSIDNAGMFPEFKKLYCSNGDECRVLPVKLLDFNGERKDTANVLLKWETGFEINNKGYDVERSLGKADIFYKVAFVQAQRGFALKNKYQLTDNNSYSGTSFYRLKLIDDDNSFTYSKVIEIKGYDSYEQVTVYPNPSHTLPAVKIYSLHQGNATYIITDAAGRQILQSSFYLQKGANNISLQSRQIPAGLYKIKIIRDSYKPLFGMFVKY